MRLLIAFQLIFEPDGTLTQRPLGYTVTAQAGGNPSLEEVDELKRRILARATSGGVPPTPLELEAPPLPRQQPEKPMSAQLSAPPTPASVHAAEAALTELGFVPAAASDAVRTYGAARCASVADWARRQMKVKNVRDPVRLITACFEPKKSL